MKKDENTKAISGKGVVAFLLVVINIIVLRNGFVHNSNGWYKILLVTFPLLLVVFITSRQKKRLEKSPDQNFIHN